MKIYTVLRSWNRGCDNAHRETSGVAYAKKESAWAAIAEELVSIFTDEEVPEKLTMQPAPVEDTENCNHDHGALKFTPEQMAATCQFEAWGPLPEGIDDPRMADWYECFEIEEMDLDMDADSDTTVTLDREYITEDIKKIGRHMWENDGPRADIVLDNPVVISRVIDARGYLDITDFIVKAVIAGRDDIPMVIGNYDGETAIEESIALTCHSTQYGHYYEESFWIVKGLINALGL